MNLNHQELSKFFHDMICRQIQGQIAESGGRLPEPAAVTESVKQGLGNVIDEIEQLSREKERLAEELLNCYNQLNVAFETTLQVAASNNLSLAYRIMAEKIAQGIDARFYYYTGDQVENYMGTFKPLIDGPWHTCAVPPENITSAQSFYEIHQAEIVKLTESDNIVSAALIGYEQELTPDDEGMGNVLCVKLLTNRAGMENLGTMVFVRQLDKRTCRAVDMNLALTLGQTGAAVLGNIIYAQKIHQIYLQTISALVKAMEAKDEYTSGHSMRVADMALALGRKVGLSDEELELLEWAGQLHDIGKIGIRDDVLTKPGKLTDEEFQHIQSHPEKSYDVLEPLDALSGILGAVRHHHEHYDGTGYPDKLKGEAIPLLARILQVADVWDALTSTRSYRSAMSPDKARAIMKKEAGTTMDPNLVNTFLSMLDSGEIQAVENEQQEISS